MKFFLKNIRRKTVIPPSVVVVCPVFGAQSRQKENVPLDMNSLLGYDCVEVLLPTMHGIRSAQKTAIARKKPVFRRKGGKLIISPPFV